jgi:hypothetical protein
LGGVEIPVKKQELLGNVVLSCANVGRSSALKASIYAMVDKPQSFLPDLLPLFSRNWIYCNILGIFGHGNRPGYMIGTLTAFQWLIYDSFKVALGLPTTGGH